MILHYNTKFGIKMICGSKHIIQTTFTKILKLCCDLDLNHSKPIWHRTLQLMMLYYKTKFGCKWTRILKHRVEIVIF